MPTLTASFNGLGATPQMGWSTWNAFGCQIDADLIKNQAQALKDKGLADLGYSYINIDDCWQDKQRDEDGKLQAGKNFPDGIKAVADDIHDKDLKLGIYSSAGLLTCQGYPGSLGQETVDAQTFSDWEVDYLKYDNCYNPGEQTAFTRYKAMSDALAGVDRDIFYSICNWGDESVASWASGIANSWRTTPDIKIYSSKTNQWQFVKGNFLQNMATADKAGSGHWNDPDMLVIGESLLTQTEEWTHFALWAFAKAPLILGFDIEKVSKNSLAVVSNKELIAINQDTYGQQATCQVGCDYTAISGFTSLVQAETIYKAVLMVNWDDTKSNNAEFDAVTYGAGNADDVCTVIDLNSGKTTENVAGDQKMTFTLQPHASQALKVKCLPF